MIFNARWLWVLFALCQQGLAEDRANLDPPLALDALTRQAWNTELQLVGDLPATSAYSAELVSYQSSGLTMFALVARPRTKPPKGGFPVLVANHGYHPDPPQYGIRADGTSQRPGDYYQQVPVWFTEAGFAVVMADYRGHNQSQGYGYTQDPLAATYYAQDVLALMDGLDQLAELNSGKLFLWGHSMGGEVTLKVLIAAQRPVLAASLWSTMGGSLWDQAYYYEFDRQTLIQSGDRQTLHKPRLARLRERLGQLPPDLQWAVQDPLGHLGNLKTPLNIHHGVDDVSTQFQWSAQIAAKLYRWNKPYRLFAYPGADHLFAGEAAQQAVARDIELFQSRLAETPNRD